MQNIYYVHVGVAFPVFKRTVCATPIQNPTKPMIVCGIVCAKWKKPAREQYPISTSNNIKQLCLFLL